MRVELDIGEAGGAPFSGAPPTRAAPRKRQRIDGFDLAVLVVFGALSMWIVAVDLWQVVVHHRIWTGTDGVYITDQMQYLSWVRSASHHFLISNMFVIQPTAADYFQPAISISGGLTALGMAPWLSLLLWKPVAVLCSFFAVRAFARRMLPTLWARRAALVLGVFFGSFSTVNGSFSVVGDEFLAFLSWGYTFGLLAVGLLVLALLAYDSSRKTGRRIWVAGLLGGITALLHPWQAELMVLILIPSELVMWLRSGRGRPRHLKLLIVTLVLVGIPLLYYEILGKADPSWANARLASKHAFSIVSIGVACLPLLIPALLGYRGKTPDFLTAVTRVWPLAAFAVWVLSASQVSATPLHAFDGIAIPLSVLAIRGVQGVGWNRLPVPRLLGGAVVAVLTIPATVYLMHLATELAGPTPGNANFINRDERDALNYLARDPQPGGVVSRYYLGLTVPGETGRNTFVGDCLWSEPGCMTRAYQVQLLFSGRLTPATGRALVRSTGAQFFLADCSAGPALAQTLAPITVSVKRFGCAAVYTLDTPGKPTWPLTQSGANAVVRTARS